VQEFRSALKDGDAAIVDRLLSAKPGLVNVKDETGRTPLADAEARGDDEMVQVLKRHGAKP
jgi:ankyrin repeat protein